MAVHRTRFLPDDDGGSGWWRLLPPPSACGRLDGPVRVASVVVGAGFTGLAIARRLAALDPSGDVLVVDAQRVGMGASGRNSGFVGDLAHRNPRVTEEETARLGRVALAGQAQLGELVEAHGIVCQWSPVGRLHVARGKTSSRNLEHLLGFLDGFGLAHQPLDAAGVAQHIGSSYYAAGVYLPGSCLVQPAALVRGVAAALPDNVRLVENTPVHAISAGPPYVLDCGVEVTCDRLFIAAGGFAPFLGVARQRVVPLLTFGSLTRALSADEAARFGGRPEWGLVSEDRMGTSLRRTQCGRILVRNCVRYRRPPTVGVVPQDIVNAHRDAVRSRWPAFDLPLEYSWAGVMSMSLNQGSVFGERGPGLYAATGFNGVGVAMGTAFGTALAETALGAETDLSRDVALLPKACWTPPEPLLGWGVGLYTRALAWRASGD